MPKTHPELVDPAEHLDAFAKCALLVHQTADEVRLARGDWRTIVFHTVRTFDSWLIHRLNLVFDPHEIGRASVRSELGISTEVFAETADLEGRLDETTNESKECSQRGPRVSRTHLTHPPGRSAARLTMTR